MSVIDTATDTVTATIEVGTSPHGLAMTPDGSLLLTAVFGANAVVFIDTSSNRVTGQLPIASPHNIAVSPDGKWAYVAAQGKGATAVVVVDIAARRQVASVALNKVPRAIGVSPDGAKLYFTLAGSDSVQVLDTRTNKITGQVPVGASPHHPLFIAGGRQALVVSQGPGLLYVLDSTRDVVSGTIKVGTLPHWIALTPDGLNAYVTNENSNDVSVVNLTTKATVATLPIGNAPRKIVIQPVAASAAVSTKISGFAFEDPVAIVAGQTVSWTNTDAVPHTVTSDDGAWSSGDIAAGASFSRTFGSSGTYTYHCANHPSMTGTIIVKTAP